ncbi:glycosyltransferase family 4 protein [uncultured Microbacterium sp.]|uniref:glycosyltransferase family 4 protein n=1 Tax=uncultured Microbacterium sp. TaxID=191216 RepID=UPI002637F731|nr:glycosyltransferase family 4 protein [uncultured Microbacterium sp.]
MSDGFPCVFLAANNGGIGGGEVMLLRIAAAMRELGVDVTAVVPAASPMMTAVTRTGVPVIPLASRSRFEWMRALRRWDRTRPPGLLWCNGLVPAAATAGRAHRVVHLHQRPQGLHAPLVTLAQLRAVATLVPSRAMLEAVPHAWVLPNWTEPIRQANPSPDAEGRMRIGFLGRLGLDKGVHILAQAMGQLEERMPGRFRLVLAGEPLFVPNGDVEQMEQALRPVAALTRRVGWVDAADFFDTVDVLVVPSIVHESFGLVAAEAMAAQVPCIVSDAGALPEVVGPRGDVVPAGDPGALADRIAEIAEREESSRRAPLFQRWLDEYSPAAGLARMSALVDVLGVRRA